MKKKTIVIFWAVAIIVCVVVLYSPCGNARTRYTFAEIDSMISWAIENELPSKCRAKRDSGYRRDVAIAMVRSAKWFRLPVLVDVAIGYRESRFESDIRGKAGELGIMQVGRYGRGKCKAYCRTMSTVTEQIDCGNCWLKKNIIWCRDLLLGLYGYQGGRCFRRDRRIGRAVDARLRLWKQMSALLGSDFSRDELLERDKPPFL